MSIWPSGRLREPMIQTRTVAPREGTEVSTTQATLPTDVAATLSLSAALATLTDPLYTSLGPLA
jgi:hypothetical protein